MFKSLSSTHSCELTQTLCWDFPLLKHTHPEKHKHIHTHLGTHTPPHTHIHQPTPSTHLTHTHTHTVSYISQHPLMQCAPITGRSQSHECHQHPEKSRERMKTRSGEL